MEIPKFKITGNTNTVFHANRLLALVESSLPTELDARTLRDEGPARLRRQAHGCDDRAPEARPGERRCRSSATAVPPYLQYHVADRSGALVHWSPSRSRGRR